MELAETQLLPAMLEVGRGRACCRQAPRPPCWDGLLYLQCALTWQPPVTPPCLLRAALPCPALPCPALPCPALHCPALPCPLQCTQELDMDDLTAAAADMEAAKTNAPLAPQVEAAA